jgi:hypothetical protein
MALGALVAPGLIGCPYATPGQARAPARKPPPRVLVVGLEHIALKTSAWVELHAFLAAAARGRAARNGATAAGAAPAGEGDPELDAAARGYADALADDDRDEALARTTRALEPCEDEKCARAAVAGSRFATSYLAALPAFLERGWTDQAEIARASIETARSALGDEADALIARVAQDLAIEWPASPAIVHVVANAHEPGREALVRVSLAARSSCFASEPEETPRMHDARIVACVLTYAALRLEPRSALAVALGRELTARGRSSELHRAWTALVVHAVATTIAGWEPKHRAVLRRSAASVVPGAMAWLAREWPSRMRGEPVDSLAKRYADAWHEQ